uniref:MI domain-containing protein n=1 Tax=Brassica campestris TaxID=3711 RepID=M4CHB0_BRACM
MGRHDGSSEEDERVRRSDRERGHRGSSTRVTADKPSHDRQKSRRESERKQGLLKRDRRERDWSDSQRGKLRKEVKSEVAKPKLPELNPSDSNAIALGKTGGVYIPPFKLARMMKEVEDKSSVEYQRAALVAVINAKFPEVAELLLKRVVLQLKRAYKRNDKPQRLAAVKFIAHLVNQQVPEETIALELVSVLLETPTDDSVEVAVGFVTECGAMLQDVTPKGLHGNSEEDGSDEEEDEEQMRIRDETETNLVNLRRTIYLTIMSSVDFEEAGHKLLKIKLEPGQEMELCIMLLECCSQERTYLRYYGLLGQRFYALPWHVLAYIRLTEEDTTSSSRIFIKILFQELSEHLGIRLLNERLQDPTMQESLESIFPKDNPKNTRFAINFFTSIGLGGITESI